MMPLKQLQQSQQQLKIQTFEKNKSTKIKNKLDTLFTNNKKKNERMYDHSSYNIITTSPERIQKPLTSPQQQSKQCTHFADMFKIPAKGHHGVYNTRGSQFRSRKEPLEKISGDEKVQINSTTMAQWQRNCPQNAIQAQMMKLHGLNIEKLHMDYKIVDRSLDQRPYLESEDEFDDTKPAKTKNISQMRYTKPQMQTQGSKRHIAQKSARMIEEQLKVMRAVATSSNKKRLLITSQKVNSENSIKLVTASSPKDQSPKNSILLSGRESDYTIKSCCEKDSTNIAKSRSFCQPFQDGEPQLEQAIAKISITHGGVKAQRDRLPTSPVTSYLKQTPKDQLLKLSTLMKNDQEDIQYESIRQTELKIQNQAFHSNKHHSKHKSSFHSTQEPHKRRESSVKRKLACDEYYNMVSKPKKSLFIPKSNKISRNLGENIFQSQTTGTNLDLLSPVLNNSSDKMKKNDLVYLEQMPRQDRFQLIRTSTLLSKQQKQQHPSPTSQQSVLKQQTTTSFENNNKINSSFTKQQVSSMGKLSNPDSGQLQLKPTKQRQQVSQQSMNQTFYSNLYYSRRFGADPQHMNQLEKDAQIVRDASVKFINSTTQQEAQKPKRDFQVLKIVSKRNAKRSFQETKQPRELPSQLKPLSVKSQKEPILVPQAIITSTNQATSQFHPGIGNPTPQISSSGIRDFSIQSPTRQPMDYSDEFAELAAVAAKIEQNFFPKNQPSTAGNHGTRLKQGRATNLKLRTLRQQDLDIEVGFDALQAKRFSPGVDINSVVSDKKTQLLSSKNSRQINQVQNAYFPRLQ